MATVAMLIPVQCGACSNPAKFHCNTCGDVLCVTCKTQHQTNEQFRNHIIVAYAEKLDPKLIVGLGCHIHNEIASYFWCRTCGVKVCTYCMRYEHQYHEICDLMIKLVEQRDVILKDLKELRDITVPKWENALQINQETIATYHNSIKKIDEEPNQNMLEIKTSILDSLKDKEKDLKESLQMMKEEVQRYENELIHIDPNFF